MDRPPVMGPFRRILTEVRPPPAGPAPLGAALRQAIEAGERRVP
jgi:hypothetical protein